MAAEACSANGVQREVCREGKDDILRHASIRDRRQSAFSKLEVDNPRDGRKVYGFKRYLVLVSRHSRPTLDCTYNATIKLSLDVLVEFCRARHMCTKDHAASASLAVHNSGAVISLSGAIVENKDNSNGDYGDESDDVSRVRRGRTCRKVLPEYGSIPCLNKYTPSCTGSLSTPQAQPTNSRTHIGHRMSTGSKADGHHVDTGSKA